MITIAVCNHKGGTAKTTTTYHLARLLGQIGISVLAIDLDPQANLTHRFRAPTNGLTMCQVLGGAVQPTSSLRKAQVAVDDHVSLVPSDIQLENVATGLTTKLLGGPTALRKAITDAPLTADICLIDCPPNLGMLTLNALIASDYILITAEPESDAIAGAQNVMALLPHIKGSTGACPEALGLIAVKVESSLNRHKAGLHVMSRIQGLSLIGEIPKRSGVNADQELAAAYKPIADYVAFAVGLLDEEDVPCSTC